MGNVVSSLVMYALQAAWFCQRLIDQDYRQNHGSRSKPIMGIHETDLDVFLSKCRTYYLSKRSGNREIQSGKEEGKRKSNFLHREGNFPMETADTANPAWSKGADSLHFDNENFLSRTDQQVSLSQPDFSRLIIDKNDLDYFLSKSMELPRGQRKSDSPKTERRKRKKVYYRKRYNPRGGDRANDTTYETCTVPSATSCSGSLLTVDMEDTDLGSCDDSSGFNSERIISKQRTRFFRESERKRLTVSNFLFEHPSGCDVEEPSLADHCYSLPKRPKSESFPSLQPPVPGDLVLVIKESDSKFCGNDHDRAHAGIDHKLVRMMTARECLT